MSHAMVVAIYLVQIIHWYRIYETRCRTTPDGTGTGCVGTPNHII